MKQMTVFDWMPEACPNIIKNNKEQAILAITHAEFEKHCIHGGSWKPIKDDTGAVIGSQHMCSYKNGKSARCWDDWIPCSEENCYLLHRGDK